MSHILFNDEEASYLIAAHVGCYFTPGVDKALARRDDEGKLLGGMLFTSYSGAGGSICIHMAGWTKQWANRDLIWACFHYAFEPLQCAKVFGQVMEHNLAALEINRRLGFVVEHKVEGVYPQGAMIVLGMKKADCRWLKIRPSNEQYRSLARG